MKPRSLVLILCITTLVLPMLAGCDTPVPIPSTATPTSVPSSTPESSLSPFVAVGEPETRDLGTTSERVRNCVPGSTTAYTQPVSRVLETDHGVEWQVEGKFGVDVRIGSDLLPVAVDLTPSLSVLSVSTIGQSTAHGTALNLYAEPNTIVTYVLRWREIWQPGYVELSVLGKEVKRIDIWYRVDGTGEIEAEAAETCDGMPIITSASTPVPPTTTPTLTSVPSTDTSTPMLPKVTPVSPASTPVSTPPAPAPVTSILQVWASEETGTRIEVNVPGVYEIGYLGDAYSVWPSDDDSGNKGWTTMLLIYRNRPVEWGPTPYTGFKLTGPINEDGSINPSLDADGDTYYLDQREAIAATQDRHVSVRLNAGEYLTVVAVDEQGRYLDNRGKVDIGVTLVRQ